MYKKKLFLFKKLLNKFSIRWHNLLNLQRRNIHSKLRLFFHLYNILIYQPFPGSDKRGNIFRFISEQSMLSLVEELHI